MSKKDKHPKGWAKKSHSNDVDPNYDVVFPGNTVNSFTIAFAPEDWAAMQADIEEIFADSLPIREAIVAAGGVDLPMEERLAIALKTHKERAAQRAAAATTAPAKEQAATTVPTTPASPGAVAAGEMVPQVNDKGIPVDRQPMWVQATIRFQDQEWTHVGVRYKGVSSLGAWTMGETRLPFKVNFDKFEDDYPEIKNQRFYGFKELAFSNNYKDPAGMRDTLVYDLFEEAGLPSLQSAPYEIAVDCGQGPQTLGLYTLIEVVDDTGVLTHFGSDDGNLYEGEGRGATLTREHADKLVASFEKKNNEDEGDWSDIWALYVALHDERRATDPAAWRAGLEAVFDVETFLSWLGISAIVGHGDTYGAAPHNFYLYNNPKTGRLTWISWDHNLAFMSNMLVSVTLGKPADKEKAPLIGYLLDDPIYFARYRALMVENFAGVAAPEAVLAKARRYADLIAPVATRHMTPAEYESAVQEIVTFVTQRAADIESFLAKE